MKDLAWQHQCLRHNVDKSLAIAFIELGFSEPGIDRKII